MTYGRAAVGLLVIHLAMLVWIAVWNAPVCDEVGHLPAGIYEWRSGNFFLYRVNPPLVKLVAAIPAAFGNPTMDWSQLSDGISFRNENELGNDFIRANGRDALWYFTAGRLLCLPFSVLGGWMCFLWGRSLYGAQSGIIACLLWCMNPVVLGWGSAFTPDAAAASIGLLAAYLFRDWLVNPSWRSAFWAGTTLGICELTKMTWIVLFAIWPALWLIWKISNRSDRVNWKIELVQLGLIFGVGIYVLNVGYGFEGTCRRLGDYDFASQSLTGNEVSRMPGNRFRGSFLSNVPIPLPYNYVRGIDVQKVDFERGMESYLFGTWSDRGWWYYYPVASCLKLPLGMLLLLASIIVCHLIPRLGFRLTRDELVLIVPAVVVFMFVCSQTGFGRYIRYILPSLPAACVLIGKLWDYPWSNWPRRCFLGLIGWSVISSLWFYPYSMSYFNEIAGGPMGGHRYLLDANVDWGQDLIRLKYWFDKHPAARPIYCIQRNYVSTYDLGFVCMQPPKLSSIEKGLEEDFVPDPGWYAVSVHELFERHGYYRYMQKYKPVGRVGYSFWIYHIPET